MVFCVSFSVAAIAQELERVVRLCELFCSCCRSGATAGRAIRSPTFQGSFWCKFKVMLSKSVPGNRRAQKKTNIALSVMIHLKSTSLFAKYTESLSDKTVKLKHSACSHTWAGWNSRPPSQTARSPVQLQRFHFRASASVAEAHVTSRRGSSCSGGSSVCLLSHRVLLQSRDVWVYTDEQQGELGQFIGPSGQKYYKSTLTSLYLKADFMNLCCLICFFYASIQFTS